MKFIATNLPDVLVVESQVFGDDRGHFKETYHAGRFAEVGISLPFVQDNHSRSIRGTLRGLHYQRPHAQGKLVRVVHGVIWDVAVDIRRDSPTFRQWTAVELSDANNLQLWVPPGFAHGFCVLSETADVIYKCTALYSPADEHTIAWNDPELGIPWPVTAPTLSARDAGAERLANIGNLPLCAEP